VHRCAVPSAQSSRSVNPINKNFSLAVVQYVQYIVPKAFNVQIITDVAEGIHAFPVRSRREKVPSIVIFFIIVGSGAKAANIQIHEPRLKRLKRETLTICQVFLLHLALDTVHHLVN
jgi:hypothetical protein